MEKVRMFWTRPGLMLIGEPELLGGGEAYRLRRPAMVMPNGGLTPYPMAVEQVIERDKLYDHSVELPVKDISFSTSNLKLEILRNYENFVSQSYAGIMPAGDVIDINARR